MKSTANGIRAVLEMHDASGNMGAAVIHTNSPPHDDFTKIPALTERATAGGALVL